MGPRKVRINFTVTSLIDRKEQCLQEMKLLGAMLGGYGEETLEVGKCIFCGAPCIFLFIVGPELFLDDAPSSFSHCVSVQRKKPNVTSLA